MMRGLDILETVSGTSQKSGTGSRGRVLVVDDHALLALGLQMALSKLSWEVETISGRKTPEVVTFARACRPQCVLVDIHVGGSIGSGMELIAPLSSTGAQVVVLTAERRRMMLAEFVEAGAVGWIGKDAILEDVDSMLGHVLAGEPMIGRNERAALLDQLRLEREERLRAIAMFERLTQREALVLSALIDGLSADEIADAHFVALTTVRSQIHAVLQKLGVRSQVAAVALAVAHQELLPHNVGAGRDRRRSDVRGRRTGLVGSR